MFLNIFFVLSTLLNSKSIGLKIIILPKSGVGKSCIISPFPLTIAQPPAIKNGTSDPILIPIEINSDRLNSNSHNLFIALNRAAASEEPPPKPELIGIFLSKYTEIFSDIPVKDFISKNAFLMIFSCVSI